MLNLITSFLLLASSSSFAVSANYTREASAPEVKAFCKAIDQEQDAEQADQAIDLKACVKSAMVVQFKMGVTTISGPVKINYPNHSSDQTCSATLNGRGKVEPKSISCQ